MRVISEQDLGALPPDRFLALIGMANTYVMNLLKLGLVTIEKGERKHMVARGYDGYAHVRVNFIMVVPPDGDEFWDDLDEDSGTGYILQPTGAIVFDSFQEMVDHSKGLGEVTFDIEGPAEGEIPVPKGLWDAFLKDSE